MGKKKKRRKLHELNAENDIRYRGPFSFQTFQIFGWLCIVMSVIVIMLKITRKVDPNAIPNINGLIRFIGEASELSLPFLLIANFARILNNPEGYKKQLLRNGGAALAIAVGGMFLIGRYLISSLALFVTDKENVRPFLGEMYRAFNPAGFMDFNIFIDLFLCTLFMYFLNSKPKRFFTGKKRFIFRAFAILPVAYELTSIQLKFMSAAGKITLPYWSFPLLTVKPPMTFIVFMILAVNIKTRELRFRRHGKTHEEYQAFLNTNRNSLHFSIFLSIILIIAGVLDLLILVFVSMQSAGSLEALSQTERIGEFIQNGVAVGFGNAAVPLMLVAPFVLLFSYTRIPRSKMVSLLIPLVSIGLMVLVVIEGFYQGLGAISRQVTPTSIEAMVRKMTEMLSMVGGP